MRKYKMCPACGVALIAEKIKGVEIDRCAKCDGVWVDAAEYAAVRSRVEIQSGGTRPSKTKDSPIISIRRPEEPNRRHDDEPNSPLEVVFAVVEAVLDLIVK